MLRRWAMRRKSALWSHRPNGEDGAKVAPPPAFVNRLSEGYREPFDPAGGSCNRTATGSSTVGGCSGGAAPKVKGEKCNSLYGNRILAARNRIEVGVIEFDRQVDRL
jgi:hypothetical protein